MDFNDAYRSFYNREFEKAELAFSECKNNFDWSYIGPFQNINGYEYSQEHEIEKTAFSPEKIYENKRKIPLKWVHPKDTDPSGLVDFSDHLPSSESQAVFFAHSFF